MKKPQIPINPWHALSKSGIIYLLLLFLSIPLLAGAQEKKVENYYIDYFNLPRESLFLHTNKTTYIVGESEAIWFTAYAYDRKSHLSSKATTNIRLGLYNASGKLIDQQLLRSKNGIASGNITLDPTLKAGDYYLKIYTQWMKNLKKSMNSYYIQLKTTKVNLSK